MLKKLKEIQHWKIISAFLVFYDAFVIAFSYFFGLWIRFDCRYSEIPSEYLNAYLNFIGIYIVICLIIFNIFKLYQSVWRFASYDEMKRVIGASVITGILHIVLITLFFERMPMSYYFIGVLLQFVLIIGIRFSYRFVILMRKYNKNHRRERDTNVMIIGAGEAGQIIIREILRDDKSKYNVACIIDDNDNKWNRYIDGIPIVGGREDILFNCKKYNIKEIMFAIPSATVEEKRDILNICQETDCKVKTLPGLYQLVNGEASVKAMKDVSIVDFLGREPISTNLDEVFKFFFNKVILITGGGGSIGSALARIIATHNPKQLILFDIYENSVYDVQQELKRSYPNLNLKVLIGSVRDSKRVMQIFDEYHPNIVYHAAAHKHVPLMEDSPNEAIKNNVIGTYKVAYAAMTHNCDKFVLISTDKAVNPTNIMGASKRMCEMIIQTFNSKVKNHQEDDLSMIVCHGNDFNQKKIKSNTEFVAVRFGNVLGSNGSVIPLFKKQIEEGGPVTVTHPDIIRYFMTIPEAASLVLLAGTYAKGGEIFVLDMGSPVKIVDLARNLIKLSGFVPDVDIKIEYTGLRPGEKLYEEKLMAEEGLTSTPNKLIHIGKPIAFDTEKFIDKLANLMNEAYNNTENIRELVMDIVSTYNPAGEHGSESKGETYERLLKERVVE